MVETTVTEESRATQKSQPLAPLRPYSRFRAIETGREVVINRTAVEPIPDTNTTRRIVFVYEPDFPNKYQVIEVNTFRSGFEPVEK
jgi:hypothetical protein